ncbi:MAG: hypothetical protein JRL30_14110 [Deltaproteobacteria bacterium]|nr:hypothetical protein [Deltaproteobacteria bacterium]
MTEERFRDRGEYAEMAKLLEGWTVDSEKIKPAFIRFQDRLSEKEKAVFYFKSRPGISYSFRANVPKSDGDKEGRLFVMVDIVDDDPENRWLSICFYGDMITDPDEEGDLVPQGLLGEDGYCFDLYEYDETAISYVAQRIDEAYKNCMAI